MRNNNSGTVDENRLAPPNILSDLPSPRLRLDDNVNSDHDHHLQFGSVFLDHRSKGIDYDRASIISSVDLVYDFKEASQVNSRRGSSVPDFIQKFTSRTFKRKTLYKKVPFLSWIQDYNTNTFLADLIAGFIISLSFLPQSLAYATIAGLPPHVGLWSAFVGPFVYVFFGTSKFVAIGPTAGLAMITLSFIDKSPPHLYIFLCFITGVTTLAMGVLHLGFLLNFISVPVISGFTSAMAISIIATQFPPLLGLEYHEYSFLKIVKATIKKIDGFSWQDLTLGITCVLVILILQHTRQIVRKLYSKNISSNLDNIIWFIATARNAIVVVVCTVVFGYLGDPLAHATIGEITPGIHFNLPPFWFSNGTDTEVDDLAMNAGEFLSENWSIMILFPLIAVTEHITIAKDLDGGNDRLDTSQEMICIGLSNIIGSFFGSMPVTGSFVRPYKTNQYFKDQSPFGGCVTGVLVILVLLFLTPTFVHIPKATIAAVIVAQVVEEIEVGIIREMWKSKKTDLLPWAVTFVAGLAVTLEHGILFGLAISGLYILYYAALPQIKVNMGLTVTGKDFVMVELDRSLTFPAVDYSQYALMKSGTIWANDQYPVVIDCSHIQFVDYSAAHSFQTLFHKFNAKPQRLILWKMKPSVLKIVKGVMECKGEKFEHCSTERELEDWLGQSHPNPSGKFEPLSTVSIFVEGPRTNKEDEEVGVGHVCGPIDEEDEVQDYTRI